MLNLLGLDPEDDEFKKLLSGSRRISTTSPEIEEPPIPGARPVSDEEIQSPEGARPISQEEYNSALHDVKVNQANQKDYGNLLLNVDQTARGIAEAGASLVTGAAGWASGKLTGLATLLLTGGDVEAAKAVDEGVAKYLTFDPNDPSVAPYTTELGKSLALNVGKLFSIPAEIGKEMVDLPLESWNAPGFVKYPAETAAEVFAYGPAHAAVKKTGAVADGLAKRILDRSKTVQDAANTGRSTGDSASTVNVEKAAIWETKTDLIDSFKQSANNIKTAGDELTKLQEMPDSPEKQARTLELTKTIEENKADLVNIIKAKENFITFNAAEIPEGTSTALVVRTPQLGDLDPIFINRARMGETDFVKSSAINERSITDILKDINDGFGETGSIGKQNLTKKQIDARNRLEDDIEYIKILADRAKLSISEHLKKLNVDPEIAIYLQQQYELKSKTTFKATDNIKENQKSLANAKELRKELLKRKLEQKGERKKMTDDERQAVESISRDIMANEAYEALPLDELDAEILGKKAQSNLLYDEKAAVTGQVTTLSDLSKNGTKKGLDVQARFSDKGSTEIIVQDKSRITKDVVLDEWKFDSLQSANEFIKTYERDSKKAEKRYYDINKNYYQSAPDLAGRKPLGRVRNIENSNIDYVLRNDLTPPTPRPELIYTPEGRAELESRNRYKRINENIFNPPSYDASNKRLGIWAKATPLKSLFEKIEARTGLPLFKHFMTIQDGIRNEHMVSIPYLKRLNNVQKGFDLKASNRIYELMELKGLDERSLTYRQAMNEIMSKPEWKEKFQYLNEREYNAAKALSNILFDAGREFGIELEQMVKDYAPRIKKEGITIDEAKKFWKNPEDYKWWAEEVRTGYLHPHETDIFRVTRSYISRGARKKALGEKIEQFTNMTNKAIERGIIDSKEQAAINKFVADVRGWPDTMDAFLESTVMHFARVLNKAIDVGTFGKAPKRYENPIMERKRVKKVDKETGKVTWEKKGWTQAGSEPGFLDVSNALSDAISLHLNLTYAGALGFRPMALIRNATQMMLSLPIAGAKHFSLGMKRAMTREGQLEAKAAGVLLDDYLPLGGEVDAAVTNWIENVSHKSMWAYTKVDNLNRSVSYHAMKSRILEHGDIFKSDVAGAISVKDIITARDKFIENSGSDFFSKTLIKNEVLPLLKSGDIQALAERMGRHAAENTQWNYRRANSPMLMQGKWGKLLGQFGTWPAWYIDYVKSVATRGTKTNRAKRIAYVVGINAAVEQIGEKIFGVDLSKWVWQHPISWGGGIAVGLAKGLSTLAFNTDEYERAKAESDLLNTAGIYIPGYLQMTNFYKASQESNTEDQFKRALGFKPIE